MFSISGVTSLKNCSSIRNVVESDSGYDIFLIAGQSNTFYGLPNSGDSIPDTNGFDSTDNDIKQLGTFSSNANIVMAGSEPLEHNDSDRANRVGWALAFAKWYKQNHLRNGRQVLLVPCGVGATAFRKNDWNPGDSEYNALVTRANIAKSIGTGSNRIKAMLWHQGESDARFYTGAQYKTAWKAMVTALETAISESDLVCVVGGLVPYAVNLPVMGYDVINTALTQLPVERNYTGYANPSSPTVISNEAGTNTTDIHYSARAMRGFTGQDFTDVSTIGLAGRYATAYEAALLNI